MPADAEALVRAKPDQGEVEIEDAYEVAPQGAVLLTWTGAFEDQA